ncbi:MAG: hypothetical protein ACRDLB_13890 [Actinomycetota bacterium]
MTFDLVILGHGVGRVYELPIPLWAYLGGAAATVLASFLVRAFSRTTRPIPNERRIAGAGVGRGVVLFLRALALVLLTLAIVAGLVLREEGNTAATLIFWVAFIIGVTALSAIVAGVWAAANPWATIERFYRIGDTDVTPRTPPAWLGPVLVYALFWFELASGADRDPFWVVAALIGYSLYSFTCRAAFGPRWDLADPLAILFGFAERSAPLRLGEDGVFYKGPLRGLEQTEPMPVGLYASVFVLLGATTFDNLSETVGWGNFLMSTGLDGLPTLLRDTVALAVLALPFLVTFMAAVWIAHRWIDRSKPLMHMARYLGWSLIPIGVAYVLAHNTPLLITGVPELVRALSDPFDRGWNLIGTSDAFLGFAASPKLVWFLEIAFIVIGHIVAVMAAHRAAVRLSASHEAAVNSQYALTVLMSGYTITTLWLLAQPLVR